MTILNIRKVSYLFVFTLVFTSQISTALSPHIGIHIDDTFEYQFSKFEIFRYINNSLVVDEDGSNLVDNTIKITINDITEGNDAFFEDLYGESTLVNVTETFKRGSFTTTTFLDMWFLYYYDTEMMFGYLIVYSHPEEGIFPEMTPPDTNDYWNFAGLPVLATTNETFYESLELEIPDYSGTPPMPPDRAQNERDGEMKLNRFTQVSLRDSIFKMNVTNTEMRSGETTNNETWSINGSTNFYVEINTQQGLVNTLSWVVEYSVVLGATSDAFIYEVVIDNLNPQKTIKVDFQILYAATLSVLGLLVINIIRRKR